MSRVSRQYVINGMLTLSEGGKYRVKSGPFKGLVLVLTKVREIPPQYQSLSSTSREAEVASAGSSEPPQMNYTPIAEMHLSGSNGFMEEEAYFSISPLNLEPA